MPTHGYAATREAAMAAFARSWRREQENAHFSTFWKWLQTAPQGQATFVGALTGSFLGLVALLLGALFNAHLNRKRDDRLRREDQRAVASALRTELAGCRRALLTNIQEL